MYECNICKKRFEKYDQLGGHISGKHNEEARKQRAASNTLKRITITKNCKKCNKKFSFRTRVNKKGEHKKNRLYCSRKCANSHTHSLTTKQKISKGCKGIVPWNKGNKKHPVQFCLKCEKPLKKVNSKYGLCVHCLGESKERSKKISDKLKEAYKKGRKIFGGTTKWYQYKQIKVQGTYELRACFILDAMKFNSYIKDWSYANDRFQYIDVTGKQRLYLPDFKIIKEDGSHFYVETKGYSTPTDEVKWKAVLDQGHILQIWRNANLKKYEKEFNIKRYGSIRKLGCNAFKMI